MMIGQVRIREIVYHEVFDLWANVFSDSRLQQAYNEIPSYSGENLCHIMEMFNSVVELVIHKRLIQLDEVERFVSVIEHLKIHSREYLSLDEATRMARMSPSNFSRQFKQVMGMSFRSFQVDNCISQAEELLRNGKCKTVQEAAYFFGFKNPFYFSRLFKKYRGYPPSNLIHDSRRTLR